MHGVQIVEAETPSMFSVDHVPFCTEDTPGSRSHLSKILATDAN